VTDHPRSSELLAAATEPRAAGSVWAHLATCLTCQVIVGRLRAHGALPTRSRGQAESNIVEDGPTLPHGLVDAVVERTNGVPAPGELWRVVGAEGMIVLVRRLVDEETIDAVPVTLDIEMADDQTLIVPSDESPLACDLAVFVGFRSHIHVGAFANRLGGLSSVAADVELIARGATRAALAHTVGPAVAHADDQRLEYQQILRTLLSGLAPAAWVRATSHSDREVPTDQLMARIDGLHLHPVGLEPDGSGSELVVLARAVCLNSVVLICRFEEGRHRWTDLSAVAAACRRVTHYEPDVDAVAVFQPVPDRLAMLFTRQDLRGGAIGLPSGGRVPPTPSLAGMPLVDLLFKHFDGSVLPTSWAPGTPLAAAVAGDLTPRSRAFAESSAAAYATQARRAHIPGKRAGWGSAGSQVNLVVSFVQKLGSGDVNGAFELVEGDPLP